MLDGRRYVPKRGDVILLEYGPDHAIFTKRVIALPGDTVAFGGGETILVNGKPWPSPSVCSKSLLDRDTNPNPTEIRPTQAKVPADQIFVIGDNLSNSFDSRIEGFVPVNPNQVIGQPAVIYWSYDSSRIGCPIR
jgi:signal peptidase I